MEPFDENMMLARMCEIELRQATAAHVDFLWETFRVSMKKYITQARGEWDEQREQTQFRNQLDLTTSRVIHANDVKVGFITAPVKDNSLWIHTICIAPAHQNRGIGTQVIRSMIAQAEKQRIGLYLSVLKVNPARRLYERLGFEVIEETRHHFKMRFHGMSESETGVT
jgi:ribosomal protein S18 acetylase RimI-like enzyme